MVLHHPTIRSSITKCDPVGTRMSWRRVWRTTSTQYRHEPRRNHTTARTHSQNRQNASFAYRRARESRFYRFFFVACHCRDWNTIAIRDGMGYPSHVFHCSNFQTPVLRRFGGTLTRLLPLLKLDDKTSSRLGYPHMSPSSISSHSSRGSVYALGVTTCSCGFVLGSSSSTISLPRRASPLGVMPIMSA